MMAPDARVTGVISSLERLSPIASALCCSSRRWPAWANDSNRALDACARAGK